MDAKFKTLTAGLAVVSALAVGGIANAANSGGTPATTPPSITATMSVADPVAPGDAADPAAANDVAGVGDTVDTQKDVASAGDPADVGKADTDNIQQGNQSGSDTADAQAGSETPGNDGPGGHADEVSGTADSTTQEVAAN